MHPLWTSGVSPVPPTGLRRRPLLRMRACRSAQPARATQGAHRSAGSPTVGRRNRGGRERRPLPADQRPDALRRWLVEAGSGPRLVDVGPSDRGLGGVVAPGDRRVPALRPAPPRHEHGHAVLPGAAARERHRPRVVRRGVRGLPAGGLGGGADPVTERLHGRRVRCGLRPHGSALRGGDPQGWRPLERRPRIADRHQCGAVVPHPEHLGGLVAGGAAGLVLGEGRVPATPAATLRTWLLLVGLGVVAVLAALYGASGWSSVR